MNRVLASMSLIGISMVDVSSSQQAFAIDAVNPPAISKRQTIKDCMAKQMIANKTMSYNVAAKACNERMKAQIDALVSSIHSKQ
jgi:hypothetical protein